MTDAQIKSLNQIVQDAATKLAEHFGSVQILCSLHMESGQTLSITKGQGDWYARQGLAHEFINRDMAQEIAVEIAEKQQPPPDNGEEWKQPE